jgi:hypothetical protein
MAAAWAAEPMRLRDAKERIGEEISVKGRTGVIVESSAAAGRRVYTLRDDYGEQAHVVCAGEYPIMGATYLIAGVPTLDPATHALYIQERSRTRLYGVPRWLLPSVAGLVLAGIGAVAVMLWRRALAARLPEAWGYVIVESGPDKGKQFDLRSDEVKVGRQQDSARGIALPLDVSVSKDHGVILRRGQRVMYRDSHSRNGSFLGQKAITPGEDVELPQGALVRLGPTTVLRVVRAGGAAIDETKSAEEAQFGEAMTEPAPPQA